MNSRFRLEWPQLIVAVLTLIAMVIVPELRNLFGLHAVAASESIAEARSSPTAQTSANATPTDDRLEIAVKRREHTLATASKIESRRTSPQGTVESLRRRISLRVAFEAFKVEHSREPNDTELDELIDRVLVPRRS